MSLVSDQRAASYRRGRHHRGTGAPARPLAAAIRLRRSARRAPRIGGVLLALVTASSAAPADASLTRSGAAAAAVGVPVVTSPSDGAVLTRRSLDVRVDADPAARVSVYDGAALAGDAAYADGTWSLAIGDLGPGEHVLTARAFDAAGGESPRSAAVRVRVASVRIRSGPEPLSREPFAVFDFVADPPEIAVACRHEFPDGASELVGNCASGWFLRDLADGRHHVDVFAVDATGQGDESLGESRTFNIDATPPDPPQVSGGAHGDTATFAFAAHESDSMLACRLRGPDQAGAFEPCGSPQTFPRLAAGQYGFSVRATDPAGNWTDTEEITFTINARPAGLPAGPAPTPAATAAAASDASSANGNATTPRPPRPKRSVLVEPTGGTIRVRAPGAATFAVVAGLEHVAPRATIDARRGRLRLTDGADSPPGRAELSGGIFTVTRRAGWIELTLDRAGACGDGAAAARRLRVQSRGAFRTRGRFATASGRHATWLLEDTCRGTLTRVVRGTVAVHDAGRKRTLSVRARGRYLARSR